jgi:catechol 2,3-dioxygenase
MLQGSEQRTLIRPTLHYFGLATARLREMLDWYAKVLGMTTNFQSSRGTEAGASADLAFVSNDRAHHRIALISWPGIGDDPDKQTHAKIQHVAFEYASIDDLLHSWERLKDLGIEPVLAARKAGATPLELHRRARAFEFPPSRPMDPRVLL